MTFTRVMYRLRERQAISSLCPLSINALQIVREKEITSDGKMGKRRFGESEKAISICSITEEHGSKRIFISYSIVCSIISSFYIVIDSAHSSRDNYNFVLSSCKLKFLTYHLRQQFSRDLSGNDGNTHTQTHTDTHKRSDQWWSRFDQAISAFRFSTYFREIFSGRKNYFRDIKSLLRFLVGICPCVIYNSCIHSFSPSRGAILAERLCI